MIKNNHFFAICTVLSLFSYAFFCEAEQLSGALPNSLRSSVKEIVVGGDKGWSSVQTARNTAKKAGRFGKEAVTVASAAITLSADIDLLLNFENASFNDAAGNYSVVSSVLTAVPDTIMGKYAVSGKGSGGGLRLKGSKKALFGRPGAAGSFTLSFWLNPALAENGETVFLWRSSQNVNGNPLYQMIGAAFFNNKLEWTFTNVFTNADKKKDVVLSGNHLVIPNKWALHSIAFDEETGLLEYRVDGKIEALTYITSDGTSSGTVYAGVLGVPAELEICPFFSGKIDEVCIRRKTVQFDYHQSLYAAGGGYFETEPFGPFSAGTAFTGITAVVDTPEQTDVQFFIRAGDNYHEWTSVYPPWVPVKSGKLIENVSGIWMQTAGALYTDGAAMKAPSVTELKIAYIEKEAPPAPVRLFAKAGDGYVDLLWLTSSGDTPSGYMVYYGSASGEYIGQSAAQGSSPVDAGKKTGFRLSGLENGKIYYFAVSAYDSTDKRLESVLSEEAYARPLKGL